MNEALLQAVVFAVAGRELVIGGQPVPITRMVPTWIADRMRKSRAASAARPAPPANLAVICFRAQRVKRTPSRGWGGAGSPLAGVRVSILVEGSRQGGRAGPAGRRQQVGWEGLPPGSAWLSPALVSRPASLAYPAATQSRWRENTAAFTRLVPSYFNLNKKNVQLVKSKQFCFS